MRRHNLYHKVSGKVASEHPQPTKFSTKEEYFGWVSIANNGQGIEFPKDDKEQEKAVNYLASCPEDVLKSVLPGHLVEPYGALKAFLTYHHNHIFSRTKHEIFKSESNLERHILSIDAIGRVLKMIEPSDKLDLEAFFFDAASFFYAEAEFYTDNPVAGQREHGNTHTLGHIKTAMGQFVRHLLPFVSAETLQNLWESNKPGHVSAIAAWAMSSLNSKHSNVQGLETYRNPAHLSFPYMNQHAQQRVAAANRMCFWQWAPVVRLTFVVKGPDAIPGSPKATELMHAMQEMLRQGTWCSVVEKKGDWIRHGLAKGSHSYL